MKKFILTCLAVFTVGLAFGQIKVGPKVGLNYAYFSENNDLTFFDEPIVAYHIGIAAEFPSTEHFAFTTEILFNTKGARSAPINSNTEGLIFHNHYISVPVGAKFKLKNFSISAGLEGAILLQERIRNLEGNWGKGFSIFENLDIGLFGGIDYTFGNVIVGLRYCHGLNNVSEIAFTDENGQPIGRDTVSNRVYQLSVAYLFGS